MPTTLGPSPWYLKASGAGIDTPEGLWRWEFYDDAAIAGLSRLLSPHGETVLFIDFNCYVQSLGDGRLLVGFESTRSAQGGCEAPDIKFIIVVLAALTPVTDHEKMALEVRKNKERIRFQGGLPSTYEFSTVVQEGVQSICSPAEFGKLQEILVLADFGPKDEASNNWDSMYRAIFAFDFREQQVTVLPQKWFNTGSYDFGYQWITRVQREPATNQIVGEGIRLGNFRLDSSGTQIEEWLDQNVFSHPERE